MNRPTATDAIWTGLANNEAAKRRLHQERQKRDDRKQNDAKAQDAESDLIDIAVPLVQATVQELEAFTVQLDQYDIATVAALNQNAIELEAVHERIERMLRGAHTLEDGTRVFRTRDGSQVFDEFGQEVMPEVVTPDEIDPAAPVWEDYWSGREHERSLLLEQEQLLDYQERLDDARDHLNDGEVGRDELDALGEELEELMPMTVRQELGIQTPALPMIENDFQNAAVQPELQANPTLPELNL